MNPHNTPGQGDGFGSPPHPPGPSGPLGPPPPRSGRYGTGLLAVLAVAAVLAGASFLGGGIALGTMLTGRVAAGVAPEPSGEPGGELTEEPSTEEPTPEPPPASDPTEGFTEEPSREPTDEPPLGEENLISSEELVNELRRDFDISARQDITDEVCASGGEEEYSLFQCTSSMDTDLVRVAAFESSGIAMIAATAMTESEDNAAADIQEACHFVLVWFDHNGLDQGERDDMADAAREVVGCP